MKLLKIGKNAYVYIVLTCIAMASMLITNVSYDSEYQIAMGLRLLQGDQLIRQMWEPHQTSAFLCAILMKIFISVTGTTTGIVLFLQVAGMFCRIGLAIGLYRLVNERFGDGTALAVAITYMLISPKELMLPEFGNMQLWCGTLLFISLELYFRKGRRYHLVLAGIWLCFGVFSYPSFIIVYGAVIFILHKYSKTCWCDIALVTGVCALIGGAFGGYLLVTVGWQEIIKCITAALAVEPSHTVSFSTKLIGHILNIGKVAGMLFATFAIGFFVEMMQAFIKKEHFSKDRFVLCGWFVLMIFLFLNILSVSNRGGYAFPFVVILGIGVIRRDLLPDEEKRMYWSAWMISGFCLVATLLLSDNAFIQAITYMLVAICMSIPVVGRYLEELRARGINHKVIRIAVSLLFGLIVFRCVFIHIPLHERDQIISLADDLSIVRSGPAVGIIAEENGVARQRDSMAEWELYIEKDDVIWIVGHPVDTLGYLYKDVEVGAPTVMSTPTYTEDLMYYYELNPDKYPDVVIVASSFGETTWEILGNEWLMNWLENEYRADEVIDGNYWKYYVKRRG